MKIRDTGSGPGNGTGGATATGAPGSGASAGGATMTLGAANRPAGGLGDLRVEPPGATSRRRIPELVLGIFLVAGCALAAVLIAAAGRERTPVLTLSDDIDRGHILTEDDLSVVYVGSDSAIAYVRQGDEDQIVGQAALADLGKGSILTTRQFVDPEQLTQQGDGLVGFTVEIGSLPSRELATGDVVSVAVGDIAGGKGEIVAQAVVVAEVRKLPDVPGQSEQWWVTLRASESDAEDLATATVGDNPVKLILVRR
jgi:hypothetical protein